MPRCPSEARWGLAPGRSQSAARRLSGAFSPVRAADPVVCHCPPRDDLAVVGVDEEGAAHHVLVPAGHTFRMRRRRPETSWSCKKSTDQRAFGTAPATRGACVPVAFLRPRLRFTDSAFSRWRRSVFLGFSLAVLGAAGRATADNRTAAVPRQVRASFPGIDHHPEARRNTGSSTGQRR